MLESIKGYGFINDKAEILCVLTNSSGQKYLGLVPIKESKSDEVLISWTPDIKSLLTGIAISPFIQDIVDIDIESLSVVEVERRGDEIWI